jgi:hypothetical protein
VNATALGWVAVIAVLFVLPPNQLAGYTFLGCVAVLAIYWFTYMRRRFRGPRITRGREPLPVVSTEA